VGISLRRRHVVRGLAPIALLSLIFSIPAEGAPTQGSHGDVVIKVLSTRSDLISGGRALVAVVLPRGVRTSDVRVAVAGRDVTRQLAPNRFAGLLRGIPPRNDIGFGKDATGLVGVITGIPLGSSTLKATLSDGSGARLSLVNHPIGGPLFDGPQRQPWLCQVGAKDRQCNQPPVISYLYKPTTRQDLQPYDRANPPSDVAETTTDQGVTVPFIVRQEVGYQDRSQYKYLTLYQPGKPWLPWAPQRQWNHKLLIEHGGGCGSEYEASDAPLSDGSLYNRPEEVQESYVVGLGLGMAVMSTALENGGSDCSVSLEAESLIMAKEQFVDQFGLLAFTIGEGCSGGALVPQQVANAYPGIYQGLVTACSVGDFWSSSAAGLSVDAHLVVNYFTQIAESAPGLWTPAAIEAATGAPLNDTVEIDVLYNRVVAWLDPIKACPGLPAEKNYDPAANPGGIRCDNQDWAVNILGRRSKDVWTPQEKSIKHGFAARPISNEGVQYGLAALKGGSITKAQFISLNAGIGGVDIDFVLTDKRMHADPHAAERAYRSGLINSATYMDQVAILNGVGNDPPLDHPSFENFVLRARLDREHGTHANQVIWEGPLPLSGNVSFFQDGLRAMNRWLTAAYASNIKPLNRAIIAARPNDVTDSCFDGNGNLVQAGLCPSTIVKVNQFPRTVAGEAPTSDDVLCRLKPLRASDYPVVFTDAEWRQLQEAFPTGVCDWTKPGVSKRKTIAWQTYQDAAGHAILGGRPMPRAPVSRPFGPSRDENSGRSKT
jgi:hypothetical protein